MAVMDTKAGTQEGIVPTSSMPADTSKPVTDLVRRSEAEQLLDQMFGDTPPMQVNDAIDEMRRDPSAPLTSTMIRLLLNADEVEGLAEVVLPNLSQNFWSRYTLKQGLELSNAASDHPAYQLLDEAEEWARWEAAGQTAATKATERLTERGIGYVYGRNGGVYRRLPDGTEETIVEEPAE